MESIAEGPESHLRQPSESELITLRLTLSNTETVQPRFRSLLFYFKLQIRICNILGCVPYEWDEKENRIIPLRSKVIGIFCKFQVVIHWVYCFLMSAYFLSPQSLKLNEMSKNLMALIFLSVIAATTLMRWTFWVKQEEAVLLWNSFLAFEEKYLPPPNPKKPVDLMAKTLLLLGIATSGGLAAFMAAMMLVDPCQPPHLGHIFYKQALHKCVKPPFTIKIAMLAFDTWIWATVITSCCFYVFNAVFLLLRCLDSYLQLLIGGARTSVTIGTKRLPSSKRNETCFKMYRRLELLGRTYDSVLQAVFLPSIFAIGIFAIIVALFTCIKLHEKIPMPGFAFFPLISCDGFAVLYIAHVAARICFQSKKFVTIMQKPANKHRQSPWEKRVSKSLDFVKVRFGSTNFVDELTPLVFLNFSLSQTVSLMLIS